MDSGSSAPNAGLFELGQLLAGTNLCPLAHDNLINLSKFSRVHTSPITSSKPDLAISPGTTGHRLSLLPLVSFSCSAVGLSLTYSVIPWQGGSPLGWVRSGYHLNLVTCMHLAGEVSHGEGWELESMMAAKQAKGLTPAKPF